MRYLDIDGDGILKPDFMTRELKKVFTILEQGQVASENLLTSEKNHYNRHFEVLRGSQNNLDAERPDFCAGLLRELRETRIKTDAFFDSLGVYLLQNRDHTTLANDSRSILISSQRFSDFLQSVWGHKLSKHKIETVSSALGQFRAVSMASLDDGIFANNEEASMNISELVARLGLALRFKQSAQLTGFRKSAFVLHLAHRGKSAREYFKENRVKNLEKRIELSEFHFILSRHLRFSLEDTDQEFRRLDPRQQGKVTMAQFIRDLEGMLDGKEIHRDLGADGSKESEVSFDLSESRSNMQSSSKRKKSESSTHRNNTNRKNGGSKFTKIQRKRNICLVIFVF